MLAAVCLHMQVSGTSFQPDIVDLAPTGGMEVYSNARKHKSSSVFPGGWKHLWICHSTSVAERHL